MDNLFKCVHSDAVAPAKEKAKKAVKTGSVDGYVYKDVKPTPDWDLNRLRTFIKTEINDVPNGDPDQVWYSVDYGNTQKDGKFYALKSHMGQKKSKTIRKSYNVDDLAAYFFGAVCEDDFAGYSQYPATLARRQQIWNQFYNRNAWVLHLNGGRAVQTS